MEMISSHRDARLSRLPFPLRCRTTVRSLAPAQALQSDVFGKGGHHSQSSILQPCADLASFRIGRVRAIALRSTPVVTMEQGEGYSTLAMQFAGEPCLYRDGQHAEAMEPGNIHLNPRTGGRVDVGFFSGIICEIEHQTLQRTIRAMRADGLCWNPDQSYMLKDHGAEHAASETAPFWSLMALTDQLLGECPYLASGLGLDDQLYRCLALSILRAEGKLAKVEQRWKGSAKQWSSGLDELIDFIRANTHRHLTITDLEERSCYSARHLQNLFRERFNCTPMQFVRRQRLNDAMAQLQMASWQTTVFEIARDCGYAHLSTFSREFKQEFGVNPSTVLRAGRHPHA